MLLTKSLTLAATASLALSVASHVAPNPLSFCPLSGVVIFLPPIRIKAIHSGLTIPVRIERVPTGPRLPSSPPPWHRSQDNATSNCAPASPMHSGKSRMSYTQRTFV
jgi:hypothetical protein